MEAKNAYWISPRGEVHSVKTTHIDFLKLNPELFKTSREEIVALHQKFKERLGQEGKAREELMINAMKKGWIRLRFYETNMKQGWSLELWDLDEYSKGIIFKWAAKGMGLLEAANFYGNCTVYITDLKKYTEGKPEFQWKFQMSLNDIVKGKLYESRSYRGVFDTMTLEPFKDLTNYSNTGDISEHAFSKLLAKVIPRKDSFVIITTFRQEVPKNINTETNASLLKELVEKRWGIYNIKGHFLETQDDGTQIPVEEDSFFVVKPESVRENEFYNYFVDVCKKYNQNSFLYSINGNMAFVDKKGELYTLEGKLTFDNMGYNYSKMKGTNRPFMFEGLRQPNTNIGRTYLHKHGIQWISWNEIEEPQTPVLKQLIFDYKFNTNFISDNVSNLLEKIQDETYVFIPTKLSYKDNRVILNSINRNNRNIYILEDDNYNDLILLVKSPKEDTNKFLFELGHIKDDYNLNITFSKNGVLTTLNENFELVETPNVNIRGILTPSSDKTKSVWTRKGLSWK